MPNSDSPPDSDLLGLFVTGVAALALIATLLAFFLVGPVVGIFVLLASGALAGYLIYRKLR